MFNTSIRLQRFTINMAIRSLREQSGLSQHELAALSQELFESEVMNRRFTQSQIARWESDPSDGADSRMRTKKLQEENVEQLAILFEHALLNVGFEGARAADLARHLHTANKRVVDPQRVSEFALHIDMLVSSLSPIFVEVAEDTIVKILQGLNQIQERAITRNEAKHRITDGEQEE
jgi:transcriptional regulator with XRE-family HTH domain